MIYEECSEDCPVDHYHIPLIAVVVVHRLRIMHNCHIHK
jgi:hypothetical protein